MPNPMYHPRFEFCARFDMRGWSGVELLHRGGDSVFGPSFTAGPAAPTAGIYADVDEFLTGRGCPAAVALSAYLQGAWVSLGGAGNLSATMTGDRVVVDLDVADTVTIDAGPGNTWWGFPPEGFTIVGPGSFTAGDWTRGWSASPPSGHPSDPSTAAAVNFVVRRGAGTSNLFAQMLVPSVVHSLRPRGTAVDSADRADGLTLEDMDNDEHDVGFRRYRWGKTSDGKVWWSAPAVESATITWMSTGFRDRLGFTGEETITRLGGAAGVDYQVATYRCPGVLVPTRPFKRLSPMFKPAPAEVVRLWDSRRIVRRKGANETGWTLEFWIDGPADRFDDHQALIDEFDLFFEGELAQLWMATGDPRLAHPGRPTPELPDGDRSRTAELHQGRRPVFVERADLDVEFDRGIMRGANVTLKLWRAEGG